jgi:hypothetical protein
MVRLAAMCAGATAMLVVAGARAQPPRYEVHPIAGLPECASVVPQAFDERGQVVGGPCLWNPSGKLPVPDPRYPEAVADSISQGVPVGHSVNEALMTVPVIWPDGKPQVLPLGPGFRQGLGLVINAHRDVLGQMSSPTTGTQAVLWPAAGSPSVITFSPRAANRDLRDMNVRRQVVGCASFSGQFGGDIVPFLWEGGKTTILEPSSASDPGGCAYAISDAGVVAGESGQRPVLWKGGAVERLAPDGHRGQALDVNNQGAAVGVLDGRSFYWDGARIWYLTELIDDQSQAAALGRVIAINDKGQILVTRPTSAAPLAGVALLEPRSAPRSAALRP